MEITSNVNFVLKNANSTVIELISGQQAIHELQKTDDYIQNFSSFDIQIRVKSSSATLEDYFHLIAQHVLPWDETSTQSISSCINNINTICIDQVKLLTFPSNIFVVLTDGKDENNAAYCRNDNIIVLPISMVIAEAIKTIFIHELFHIWSRYDTNTNIRNELYASIGYYQIPEENSHQFPEDLSALKLTNPDAPLVMKYYINLKKLTDSNEKTYKCTPILIATRQFDPKFSTNMFAYVMPTTLILDDDTYEPLKPLQFLPYNKASNFYVQIGKNTGYTVHPEEISAEHFVLWMTKMNYLNTLNSPDVIDKMNQIMIRAANHF